MRGGERELMSKGNCLFCNEVSEIISQKYKFNGHEYRCKSCGNYIIEVNAQKYISNKDYSKKHYIAGYLSETKHLREYSDSPQENELLNCFINETKLESILTDPLIPKTTMKKLEKLLIYLYRNSEFFGKEFLINEVSLPVAYASNDVELTSMFNALVNLGYGNYRELTMDDGIGFGDGLQTPRDYIHKDKERFILNINGHSHAEELISSNKHSNKVFVAMEFKGDLLEAMKNAIRPACNDCGFDAHLISDKEHNNGITDEIIAAIKNSKFIITDFTYNNCGAYFEAGYAQGYGLEVIRCCNKVWFDGVSDNGNKNKLHFDI